MAEMLTHVVAGEFTASPPSRSTVMDAWVLTYTAMSASTMVLTSVLGMSVMQLNTFFSPLNLSHSSSRATDMTQCRICHLNKSCLPSPPAKGFPSSESGTCRGLSQFLYQTKELDCLCCAITTFKI